MATLWKSYDATGADGEPETRRFMRTFSVWNADQTEGLPEKYYAKPDPFAEITEPQAVADAYFAAEGAPALFHDQADRAFYRCDGTDEVHLPPAEQFRSPQAYYSTLFHEAGHSTGWNSRLGRTGIAMFDHFGSGQYASEELVAEMTSAFLNAQTGVEGGEFEQSAAYVANWLSALKNDKKLVVHAASQASAAADLILSYSAAAEDTDIEAGESVAA